MIIICIVCVFQTRKKCYENKQSENKDGNRLERFTRVRDYMQVRRLNGDVNLNSKQEFVYRQQFKRSCWLI